MRLGETSTIVRHCASSGSLGCHSATSGGETATICYCSTDYCNGAVMTSSFGHVIIAVAVLINVITAYQLL